MWVGNADLAIERIADRVRRGGHSIPENVVRRRFAKGLTNFGNLYRPILDSWFIFDNSKATPKLIAFEKSGKREILDPEVFDKIFKSEERL